MKLNIFYREENSVISISINSIENVSNLLIRTKFDRSLKIKLRNKEKIQKNSFKVELKSINDDNILNIDRKVDFRLSKLYFQKSEIIVSKEWVRDDSGLIYLFSVQNWGTSKAQTAGKENSGSCLFTLAKFTMFW